jgi:hypothetical protein
MARLYCVVVVLLLLVGSSRFGEGDSNPGFMVRITRKGLEYGKRVGLFPLMPTIAYYCGMITKTVNHRLGLCNYLV